MAVEREPHLPDAAAQGDDHPRSPPVAHRQGAAQVLAADRFVLPLARARRRPAGGRGRAVGQRQRRLARHRRRQARRRPRARRDARRPRSSTACRWRRPRAASSIITETPARHLARILCGLAPLETTPGAAGAERRPGDGRGAAPAARQLRHRLLALQDDHGRPPHPAPRRDAAARRPARVRRPLLDEIRTSSTSSIRTC